MERMIEVCAGSYQDCIVAYQGKAKRVELNSALSVGGLTPSVASLVRVKKETDLTVICMVRPRAAGFCYEKEDVEIGRPHNLYPLATESKYITCPQCNEKIELEATK